MAIKIIAIAIATALFCIALLWAYNSAYGNRKDK